MVVEPVEPSELTGFGPTTVLVTARLVSMSVGGGGLGGIGVDPVVVGAGARSSGSPLTTCAGSGSAAGRSPSATSDAGSDSSS